MNITSDLNRAALCIALAAALAPAAARADRALVVGVNKYPDLPKASQLEGCVNDARSMGALLRQFGFQVTELADDRATKQGILNALAAAKAQVQSNDRFVFYFAGHGTDGTTDDVAALLPSDAGRSAPENDLRAKELYAAVRVIAAKNKSVILDSCYSGGMLPSSKSIFKKPLTTRYFPRAIGGGANGLGSKSLVPTRGQDSNAEIGGPGVCYFTAARGNEQSAEDDFKTQRHGVFTYYLTTILGARSRETQRPTWGAVQSDVSGEVTEYLKDVQHPTLSPGFEPISIFQTVKETPPPGPVPPPAPVKTLWDELNGDFVDKSKIEMIQSPNVTTLRVGEKVTFSAKVGVAGYLILLENGTSGKLNLLHPEARMADKARVEAGQTVRIPTDVEAALAPDSPGHEYLRAILFTSKEQAQNFINRIPEGGATRKVTRDFKKVKVPNNAFYTSDITFEVVNTARAAGRTKRK